MDALLARLPSRLVTEWMVFYGLEPWGEERADLRAGIVASTVANVHRAPGSAPLTADEFMPRYDEYDEPESDGPDWERLLATVELLNVAFGGRDLRH